MGAKVSLPYELGEEYASNFIWKMHRGVFKQSNKPVTIFVCNVKENGQEKVDYARSCLKRSKLLKHPSFISYIDGGEVNDMIYIVTEPVTLLQDMLTNMYVEIGFTELLAWGLYQVLQGILFLHSRQLYHGFLSKQSIYVDSAGEMKIGELGFLFDLSNGPNREPPSLPTFPLRRFYPLLEQKYKPPELISQRWDLVEQFPVALDAYGLGCLIYEVFEGPLEHREIKVVTKVPKTLTIMYHNLISEIPTTRLKITELPYCAYFARNQMIETQCFLDQIAVKDQAAIESFIMQLGEYLESLPRTNCKYKIFPKLLDAIKYGPNAASHAINSIFKIGAMFNDPNEYRDHFLMKIIVLFDTNDDNVRLTMLQNLNSIVPHLPVDVVEKHIYSNVSKGFTSVNPGIREATVKAMIEIVPRLTEKTVEEDVVKHLWNLQGDKEPGIRTNTVIAFGKLSKNFSDSLRKKLLLPAFARTLRDPFVPSRLSSLRAILATREFYSVHDIATKIIPIVSPLVIDPLQDVRELSLQVLNTFVQALASGITSSSFLEEAQRTTIAASSQHASATPNNGSSSDWANWALSGVSTLKNKIIGSNNDNQPNVGAISSTPASVSSYGSLQQAQPVASSGYGTPSQNQYNINDNNDPFSGNVANIKSWESKAAEEEPKLNQNEMDDLIAALQHDEDVKKKPPAVMAKARTPAPAKNVTFAKNSTTAPAVQQQEADLLGLLDTKPTIAAVQVKPKTINELRKEKVKSSMIARSAAKKKEADEEWSTF